jgi:thymidylate synthase (FAD)
MSHGTTSIEWATPDIDERIAYMARVSNPDAKPDDPYERLIKYLIDHKHWSPFEMASICVKITTTRDIARQLLRHRSFHFQEFSQRYAAVDQEKPVLSQARLQDTKNRQNSIATDDPDLQKWWTNAQNFTWSDAQTRYQQALNYGVAKEVARKLLPEGLTTTHLFMCGTVRDWYHYLNVRTGPETQLEHRELAEQILAQVGEIAPSTFDTLLAPALPYGA